MARVLIAEDDSNLQELYTYVLQYAGFDVVTAGNGEQAVQAAYQSHPDLIILDVRMPKMTGFQACEMLRWDEGFHSVPIVFLTVRGQEEDIRKGFELGANDYWIKPIHLNDLVDRVRKMLKM